MKAPAPERRTSLRLSAEQHEAIERLCHQDGGKVPMSSWIARATDILGDWWTPLVVRSALLGVRRFDDFVEDDIHISIDLGLELADENALLNASLTPDRSEIQSTPRSREAPPPP